jgi:hypothetical protein
MLLKILLNWVLYSFTYHKGIKRGKFKAAHLVHLIKMAHFNNTSKKVRSLSKTYIFYGLEDHQIKNNVADQKMNEEAKHKNQLHICCIGLYLLCVHGGRRTLELNSSFLLWTFWTLKSTKIFFAKSG